MKELLEGAKAEIEGLRRTNEVLGAKVETMEMCSRLLNAQAPSQGWCVGEDILSKIKFELDKLDVIERAIKAGQSNCQQQARNVPDMAGSGSIGSDHVIHGLKTAY